MTWAVLVINIKGGTGKSTVAEELAKEIRNRGYSTGIFDADIDSANLSSRLGVDEMVSFKGDHTIEPVEHEGMKLYSMENAFSDSTFSQTGQFMSDAVDDMINHSEWGDLDYMVVDCPPGSSDIFEELVRSLRANILGSISVGISDAVEDTNRLVKVCNHNWVPILGFIENMSGIYCHGEEITCSDPDDPSFSDSHPVQPFGQGLIEAYAEEAGGNFIGRIPLCVDETEIMEVAPETIESAVDSVEEAANKDGWPKLPDDNVGDKGFIANVWGAIQEGVKQVNNELDVGAAQEKFGVEERDPLTIELELKDATGLKSVLSGVILNVERGEIKVMRRSKAKKGDVSVDAGIRITSQDLFDSLNGEKEVMRSVTGGIITTPYSISDAIKMGDAEMWGDKPINRLVVLDRILNQYVDEDQIKKVVN